MNVSAGSLEIVREKLAQGECTSTSEVVPQDLRLPKHREELWKAKIRSKIEEGMASLRAGHTISAEEVRANIKARIAEVELQRGVRILAALCSSKVVRFE